MEYKIDEIIKKINGGCIIIFPTDTVYGMGALPEKKYVNKLYEIKKRDFSKKIIALISDIKKLEEIVDDKNINNKKIKNVLDKFWPGELTVIFKGNKKFLEKFDSSMNTVGIRIPKNKIALEIIEKCGGILLTTSANLSGEMSVTKIDDINKTIIEKVDVIIESNDKLSAVPSTIIKYENEEISLIREGNIKFEDILKVMKG